MQTYLLALSFLTCLPIKINYEVTREQMGRTLTYYPVVGLTLGLMAAGAAYLGDFLHLGLAGDVMTVGLLVALTAGLHLDGLMDTADGLLSGQPQDRKLEIMKDSSVGAMGVIVLAVYLLLKVSLVSGLFWPDKYRILIIMPAVGRWAMVYTIAGYPYARSKPGLGSIFDQETGRRNLAWATIISLTASFLLLEWMGLLLFGIIFIIVYFFTKAVAASLGGHTGDTYGATGELAELAYLFLAVLISSIEVKFGWGIF